MAQILFFDPHEEDAMELARRLKAKHHTVTSCTKAKELIQHLKCHAASFDVVILDVSAQTLDLQILNGVNCMVLKAGQAPAVVCVSRVYKGPQMQLQIERKGARLVYVR